jgi:hypothetical protein
MPFHCAPPRCHGRETHAGTNVPVVPGVTKKRSLRSGRMEPGTFRAGCLRVPIVTHHCLSLRLIPSALARFLPAASFGAFPIRLRRSGCSPACAPSGCAQSIRRRRRILNISISGYIIYGSAKGSLTFYKTIVQYLYTF